MTKTRKNLMIWFIVGLIAGFTIGLLFQLVLLWTAVGAVIGLIVGLTLNKLNENS